MQKYEKLEKIGEGLYILINYRHFALNFRLTISWVFTGTYGTVFKAKNRENQEIVALKRVRLVSYNF